MPERVYTLGVDDEGQEFGIYESEKLHTVVLGTPGSGKSTLLKTLILQDIADGVGVFVLDPHADLIKAILAHIKPEDQHKVVYIDPTTASSLGRVVQINFLEARNMMKREITTQTFLDALKKLYRDAWGPRLEMILQNALYVLIDQPQAKLSDVYTILNDEVARQTYLARVTSEKILRFWREQFKTMAPDAKTAVETKLFKLLQNRVLEPMFDCVESSINFRALMDEGKIILVNLSEGAISSDLADFLGSLLLSQIYLDGMSREALPPNQRRTFNIYIDEAHRFTTDAIPDILRSLRKYKVFATLATQSMMSFAGDMKTEIVELCDTVMTFSAGPETIRIIKPILKTDVTIDQIVTLPTHWFAVSAKVHGSREFAILKTIHIPDPNIDIKPIIKRSLEKYGRQVETHGPIGAQSNQLLPYPQISPVMWQILSTLFFAPKDAKLDRDEIIKELVAKKFEEAAVDRALNEAIMNHYIMFTEDTVQWTDESNREHQKRVRHYYLDQKGFAEFNQVPVGQRGGGDRHLLMMRKYFEIFTQNGWYSCNDLGQSGPKLLPDMLVFRPLIIRDRKGNDYVDPYVWDNPHRFAVEIEADPERHPERVYDNWEKCYNWSLPVIFVTDTDDRRKAIISAIGGHAKIVDNIMQEFGPGYAQIIVEDLHIPEKDPNYTPPPQTAEPKGPLLIPVEDLISRLKNGYTPRIRVKKDNRYLYLRYYEDSQRKELYLGKVTPEIEAIVAPYMPKADAAPVEDEPDEQAAVQSSDTDPRASSVKTDERAEPAQAERSAPNQDEHTTSG